MSDNLFISHNGELLPAAAPRITAGNRSFRYGDGLFETIRIARGSIQFLNHHVQRLIISMRTLKLDVPSNFTENYFRERITELAQKNNVSKGARVRLTVFRNEGGFYTPRVNSCSYVIECEPIEDELYTLNLKGYTVEIFQEHRKQINKLANLKTNNALLNVLAGVHRLHNNLDDCIILNQNMNIVESISSNIFAAKGGVLYTPHLTEGCVDGIMRRVIIDVAKQNRIAVYEISVAQNVLLASDELFLTNAISGIRWVAAYKSKRFSNEMSKLLLAKLNENLI